MGRRAAAGAAGAAAVLIAAVVTSQSRSEGRKQPVQRPGGGSSPASPARQGAINVVAPHRTPRPQEQRGPSPGTLPEPAGHETHPFIVSAREHQAFKERFKKPRVYPALTPAQRAAALAVPDVKPARAVPGLRRAPGDFDPGSLPGPVPDVLSRCYFPRRQYRHHIGAGAAMTSRKHRVALVMGPKSGSSTSRHLIELFHGQDERRAGLRRLPADFWRAWLVREPLSRFYAQYEEVMGRSFLPSWRVPRRYKWRAGLPSYAVYAKLFDDSEGMNSLSSRFEAFVQEYDGVNPIDVHLVQQVPSLSDSKGRPLRADMVAQTHEVSRVLAEMREHAQPPWQDAALLETSFAKELLGSGGRAFPRRFNVSRISASTKRRICMFAAVDYCCLNYRLPPACASAPPGERVRCAYVDSSGSSSTPAPRIEPVIA